jgi:LuxR family maltose regulon positive regulatory protein
MHPGGATVTKLNRQPTRTASARTSTASPLHSAKLRRPVPVDHYVARPRLLELLDEVARGPLTLVVAPAGSGKTALLAGWLYDVSTPSAWISLDEADRDPVQFWSGMIAALETLAPGCGSRASARLRSPGPFTTTIVDELVEDLDTSPLDRAILVVDDFHVLDDDVAASVGHLLSHQPGWLSLVVASRRTPPLPIDRMRSRGQLGEVSFGELRFSSDEATQLLANLTPSLAHDRVEAMVARADGWAASLQLAALAARSARARHDVTAIDPTEQRLVHDYVLHEVLGGEVPELKDILSAVSVVPRANAALAAALTLRADAGDQLLRAERRGLFVMRLEADEWFEVHDLVREVLTAELSRRTPEHLDDLHRRAAAWYEASGEVIPALDHWVLARRPRDALRLLAQSVAHLYDTGREAVVERTVASLPSELTVGDSSSMILFAWCHLLVDRRRFLELVEQVTWRSEELHDDVTGQARATMLRSIAASIRGRWEDSAALARESMADLGNAWSSDPLGRFAWNLIVRHTAMSERWDDSDDIVRHAAMELMHDPERRLSFEGTRALGAALSGRPIDALRVAAGVSRAAAVSSMSILRTELEVAEALAHRELGDSARALIELEALADAPAEAMLHCRILAIVELAYAHLEAGDLGKAWKRLDEARALVDEGDFGPDVRNWVARLATSLGVSDGNIAVALRWAAEIEDSFWNPICAARVQLAAEDGAAATTALDTAVPRCPRHQVVLGLLTARATGDRDRAMAHAASAIELAAATGLLQTVAAEGAEAVELAEHVAWRVPAQWLDRLRRTIAEAQVRTVGDRADFVEPLTDRERDVLRFLPSRLTVREIADELYVSVNTLKFHLKVIYRKLGVNSRAEAAEVARKLMSVRR